MNQFEDVECIARISEGKDSLKMLDVIKTRGLQLDRVTTTDVWATDTIRAELPEVLIAKERIEEKLWQMYRITVEHLCARNSDGSKRTYEQMFYHIPTRRSKAVQVERETGSVPDRSEVSRICGTNGASPTSSGMPGYRVQGSITGFPPNTRYNWCQKLKIVRDSHQGLAFIQRKTPMVSETQNPSQATLFAMPCHEGQEKKDRGIYRDCSRRAKSFWSAKRMEESTIS